MTTSLLPLTFCCLATFGGFGGFGARAGVRSRPSGPRLGGLPQVAAQRRGR